MEVCHNSNGSVTVSYTPTVPGVYKLSVERDGECCADFPMCCVVQEQTAGVYLTAYRKMLESEMRMSQSALSQLLQTEFFASITSHKNSGQSTNTAAGVSPETRSEFTYTSSPVKAHPVTEQPSASSSHQVIAGILEDTAEDISDPMLIGSLPFSGKSRELFEIEAVESMTGLEREEAMQDPLLKPHQQDQTSVLDLIATEPAEKKASPQTGRSMTRISERSKRSLAQFVTSSTDAPAPSVTLLCKAKGCKSSFTSIAQLRQHVLLHKIETKTEQPVQWKPRKRKTCHVCSAGFASHEDLTKHLQDGHKRQTVTSVVDLEEPSEKTVSKPAKSNQVKTCDSCGLFFPSKQMLTQHTRRSHTEQNIDMLPGTLHEEEDFEPDFEKQDQASAEKPYVCPGCDKAFSVKRYMNEHFKRMHAESQRQYRCDQCNKVFNYKRNLTKHIMTHSKLKPEKKTSSFICATCGKKLNSRSGLNVHINRVHNSIDDPFVCEFCQKPFKLQSDLRRHIGKMHNENRVNSVCEFCARSFLKYDSLRDHIEAEHKRSQFYNCPDPSCKKKFPTEHRMKVHHKQVHQTTIGHQCPDENCGKLFKSPNALRIHLAKKQGYRWMCTYEDCNLYFTTKNTMLRHVQVIHENLKPSLACSHPGCKKVFRFKDKLKMHEKTHVLKEELKCPICAKTFLVRGTGEKSHPRQYAFLHHMLDKHGVKIGELELQQ